MDAVVRIAIATTMDQEVKTPPVVVPIKPRTTDRPVGAAAVDATAIAVVIAAMIAVALVPKVNRVAEPSKNLAQPRKG
jgi:hypothetical protein